MDNRNLRRLRLIARGLQELGEQVVYVGGSVVQLYASDAAQTDIRPTDDVDFVVDLSSYKDYVAFCEQLRKKHFHNDTTPGAPICRWVFEDERVDVMTRDGSALGFTNRWYEPGMKKRSLYELSEGLLIHILPETYFVAS